MAMLGAAAMVIGGFGPWATALGFVSVNGTQGDGWILIAAGVAALAALWREGQSRSGGAALVLAGVAGAIGAAVAITDFTAIQNASQGELFGESFDAVDAAWGIYAAMIGSVVLAAAMVGLYFIRRAPGKPR
jgi:hypothetical protein